MMKPAMMAAATLLLVGCAGLRPQAPVPGELVGADRIAVAAANQQARTARLGLVGGQCDAPTWRMVGRVALSNGKDGGSGRIEWMQGNGSTQVTLSAPVTRQSWTLVIDANRAVLDGVPNGPLHGTNATRLLRDATGWEIPVTALGCWLRGVAADPVVSGAPGIRYGTDLLPLRLEQGGWLIDFAGWKPDPATGTVLPSRINAQSGENRVRLVVDGWDGD